jgi:hypothetical protein
VRSLPNSPSAGAKERNAYLRLSDG